MNDDQNPSDPTLSPPAKPEYRVEETGVTGTTQDVSDPVQTPTEPLTPTAPAEPINTEPVTVIESPQEKINELISVPSDSTPVSPIQEPKPINDQPSFQTTEIPESAAVPELQPTETPESLSSSIPASYAPASPYTEQGDV